jgi:hypothetical protein
MPELPENSAFEWIRFPWGEALRCASLVPLADHCFTTRHPRLPREGLSPGDGWHRIAFAFGLPAGAVVRLRQVHGTAVVLVRAGDAAPANGSDWGRADIAATDAVSVALSVRVADCVPVLLADRRSGAVAAAHAGWRGTAAGAAGAAVEALVSGFGADPRDLVAAIGPSIGPCCYRVGAEVRDLFRAAGRWTRWLDRWFSAQPRGVATHGIPGIDPARPGGRPAVFLDTWAANADQLVSAGVPAEQVHTSRVCTSCHRDIFHSYRVDGERAGRMVGVIRVHRRP